MTNLEDIMISDLEDEDFESSYIIENPSYLLPSLNDLEPFTLKLAFELRKTIFGHQNATFSSEWTRQGLASNHPNVIWGMVQNKGGPCGILAVVQAKILKEFIAAGTKDLKTLTTNHVCEALVKALTSMLWEAGNRQKGTVVLNTGVQQFVGAGGYRSDGITENLASVTIQSYKKLQEFINSNIYQFQSESSGGVVLMLYSIVLSRGFKQIQQDFDQPETSLIAIHKHCTQELVNLLLVGKALSNVHDDDILLTGAEDTLLKGIPSRSDVGLLSLYEHYRIVKVGKNLKTPIHPVWVVCSENHYSVLFSMDEKLVKRDPLDEVTLYYFDGLAKMDREIKLTLSRGYSPASETRPEHLIPPLELCIRSKWNNYSIDWHEQEPIL